MVPVSEKKQLLEDLRLALDDQALGSVSVLVRKALMLAALFNDTTHEALFEMHLLGLDMWVKSGNKEVWERRGVEDNVYVAKANVADRAMQNGNVNGQPLDDIERLLELLLKQERLLENAGQPDISVSTNRIEQEQILDRIRSRVALFAARAQLAFAGQAAVAPPLAQIESTIVKRCPQCHRTYPGETFSFCLDDGALLSAASDPDKTLVLNSSDSDETVVIKSDLPS